MSCIGRHVFLHEVVDCPLVSGGYCFLLRPSLPLKIVRFIPPPAEAGESSCYVLNLFLVSDLSTVVPGSYSGSADLLTLFPSGRDTKLVSNTTIYSSPC